MPSLLLRLYPCLLHICLKVPSSSPLPGFTGSDVLPIFIQLTLSMPLNLHSSVTSSEKPSLTTPPRIAALPIIHFFLFLFCYLFYYLLSVVISFIIICSIILILKTTFVMYYLFGLYLLILISLIRIQSVTKLTL